MPHPQASHGAWLWRLAGAFAFRVVAQPAAALTAWPVPPAFEAWQSGALPYGWLLASQLSLMGGMALVAARVSSGAERRSRTWGRWLAGLAALYGAVMTTRLALGLTAFRGHWWLDAPLPTVFHLVLTTYLAVWAHYHLGRPTATGTP